MKSSLTILLILMMFTFVSINAQTPTTPTDGATDVSQSLSSISWTHFDDGSSSNEYDFELSANSDYSSPITSSTGITTNSENIGALNYYTDYFWRVRDTDTDGSGTDGNWHEFTFKTIDNYTPTLPSPSNGATNVFNGNVALIWNLINRKEFATQVNYKLEYGTDSGLAGATVVNDISITSHSLGLDPGVTYYWRITTVKNSVEVASSAIWSFTTSGTVSKPIVSYPKDETTVYATAPVFYWYTTGFSTQHYYEIEWLANSSDFDGGAPTSIDNIQGLFAAVPNLTGGDHVYWRVRSKLSASNFSAWSDTS